MGRGPAKWFRGRGAFDQNFGRKVLNVRVMSGSLSSRVNGIQLHSDVWARKSICFKVGRPEEPYLWSTSAQMPIGLCQRQPQGCLEPGKPPPRDIREIPRQVCRSLMGFCESQLLAADRGLSLEASLFGGWNWLGLR